MLLSMWLTTETTLTDTSVCDPGKNDSNPRHQKTWLNTFVYHDKNFYYSLKGLMDKTILYK